MKRVHMIGIGGSGLSAIALLLHETGYTVTGSDLFENSFVRDLRSRGVTVYVGHRPENVAGANFVVRSSAIPDDNAEVQAAKDSGIPVYKRADFLGQMMTGKTGIAVAGTHGKTTVTAMLAWTMTALNQQPSFIVGSVMNNLGVNASAGKGVHFIIEADEYDRMFLGLNPFIAVVTNIEHDHPDCYPTAADFYEAFLDFVRLLPENGTLIACAEDPTAQRLMEQTRHMNKRVIAYGCASDESQLMMDMSARNAKPGASGCFEFEAVLLGQMTNVALSVPGRHNVLNALAVLGVIRILDLPIGEAAKALGKFSGTKRRFEVKGEANGIVVIDDYAHHPTEIRTTLAAARSRYPDHRIWVVWQPHTFSRTKTLFNDFTRAFGDADQVIVTEVFKAREPAIEFSAEQIVKSMQHPAKRFIPGLPEVSHYLISHLQCGDVLLVLSAGDADWIGQEVLTHLKESEETHE